jgi:hypothetical protein
MQGVATQAAGGAKTFAKIQCRVWLSSHDWHPYKCGSSNPSKAASMELKQVHSCRISEALFLIMYKLLMMYQVTPHSASGAVLAYRQQLCPDHITSST